jgi:hypothetical protein
MLNSCFAHAIAIAEGKVLSKLMAKSRNQKTSLTVPDTEVLDTKLGAGETNQEDTEDTEEEISDLLKGLNEDIDTALGEDNFGLREVATLLLKV